MYLTCVVVVVRKNSKAAKTRRRFFAREKTKKKANSRERKNKKKGSRKREFLTSQRTHLNYHRILLIHYFNKEEEEKNVPIYAFHKKVISDRTERLYERDDEKTRDKEERKRREFSRGRIFQNLTL